MESLTDNQLEFLLQYFFKNEEFERWKNIAIKLLINGSCIVAGKDCIWKGGIGNFIETIETDETVDCLKYTFDLDSFLSSEWFKSIHNSYISELAVEKREIEHKYNEITRL